MHFVGKVLAAVAVLCAALGPTGAAAQASPPARPAEFVRIEPPQPVAGGDKIEVTEFFYYGCPICYELEPMLVRWLANAPPDIVFRRVPALASPAWEDFARLHYTLESMGELARLHWPVYESFHFDGVDLAEEKERNDWIGRNGVDGPKFAELYASPAIQEKVAQARGMVAQYGVKGVPSIAVDGRFLTSARMAGGTRELMPVVDKLIELARKERAK